MQDDLKINILRIEILQKKVEYLHSILENIPNAIEEFGYVDLSYDNGKKQMKIGKLNET
jgi:rRNA processing protein Krr1/Pno1